MCSPPASLCVCVCAGARSSILIAVITDTFNAERSSVAALIEWRPKCTLGVGVRVYAKHCILIRPKAMANYSRKQRDSDRAEGFAQPPTPALVRVPCERPHRQCKLRVRRRPHGAGRRVHSGLTHVRVCKIRKTQASGPVRFADGI